MFRLRDCPTQGQAQTIISRLLKNESVNSPDKEKEKSKNTAKENNRKRNYSESTTEEEVCILFA